MWQEGGTLPFDHHILPTGLGRRGGERKGRRKRERIFRVRSSHFSLNFPMIIPSNSGEARGKVDPHYKSYLWVPKVWSFDKLREVGVFSYLDILCLKGHENGFGCCEARNGHGFWFQINGTDVDEGAVHGQPTYCYGTVKKSKFMVGLKIGPCVLLACYCLN